LGVPQEAWGRVYAGLLDAPGMTVFLARRDGEAVSAVSTVRAGPVVCVWAMGTPADHQRRGYGRALLDGAIRHHQDRGAALFYLVATDEGKPLYGRIGFRTLEEVAVWFAGDVAAH
jgi:GNAT superfamily N-acetyltransferase